MSTIPEIAGTSALAAPLAAPPSTQTSSLERYLAQIADPALRENISREIAGMGRTFGLVFERHHPEGIRLPKHRVKRHSKVIINTVKDSGYYRVARLQKDAGTALLVDEDGNQSIYPVEQLTVAKEFGDVMYPGLKRLSEVRRGAPDAPVHTIINGENYHALEALQYTHSGKVDLIYIDPPYNTGNADWKYNDRYIDSKDGYRHSKWLSFMEKRLLIAKQLLTPTGVLIMAIGDDEHHRLRMLADETFGESNFISSVVWQGGRKNLSKLTSNSADYMLMYARDLSALNERGIEWREPKPGVQEVLDAAASAWRRYRNSEKATAALRQWFSSLPEGHPSKASGNYNYDFVDEHGHATYLTDMSSASGESRKYAILDPTTGEEIAAPGRGWAYSKPVMNELIATGKIHFYPGNYRQPRFKRRLDETGDWGPDSVFYKDRRASARHLEAVLGDKRFPFPKDHTVLMRWFRMVAPADAVILDFFGGSGTTAEAVIRLNAEDGGTRQAMLVTNNELAKKDDAALRKAGHVPGDDGYEALGVFHHVTKPRLETVVTGIRQDGSKYSDGLDANVAFFELTYLDEPEIVTGRALNDLAGLFWLKSGGAGGTVDIDAGTKADGYAISESGATAILFSPGRARALAEKLKANGQAIHDLFIVTDSEAQGDEAASHFAGGINVERIYGSYLEAFQVNRKD